MLGVLPMNNTNPEDTFYEKDCPLWDIVLTSFEIGLYYESLWDGDSQ